MLTVIQDTSRIRLYYSPIIYYLAVRGIDKQSQLLRSAFFYTPILAGILQINRLIILEVAILYELWPELKLDSKADVDSVPDRIYQLRELYLCEGLFLPTSSILTQLAIGKKFNKTHQSPSNIYQSDREHILYVDRRITRINKSINIWFPGAPYRFKSNRRQYSIELGISATEFQFYQLYLEPGLSRRGL